MIPNPWPFPRALARLVLRVAVPLALALPLPSQAPTAVDLPSIAGLTGHAVAYDAARERIVLFGGRGEGATAYRDETWIWSGSTWHLQSPVTAPSPRGGHAMAFDAARRRVVLFGGYGPLALDDTWEWDGRSWVQRNPVHRPPASSGAAMAYDSARQRIVLVVHRDNRTWEWDGTDWIGINVPPPGQNGYSRALAFDTVAQRTLYYVAGAVHEWDGTSWQRNSASPPQVGIDPAMVWDAVRRRMVLHVGRFYNLPAETWEYDGAQWTAVNPPNAPGYSGASLAYDAARGETLAVGGVSAAAWPGAQNPVETLAWDGSSWRTRHFGAGHGSSARGLTADTARGVLVSVGTYQLGGTGFGGTAYGKTTREWDGVRWWHHAAATTAAFDHAITFDSARGVSVLFGGVALSWPANYLLDETWEWDGAGWTQSQPSTSPPARERHAMAFDAARGTTLLFGGRSGSPLGDTWTFDGIHWTQRSPANTPSARDGHGLAFDPVRGIAVLHGGRDANGIELSDTWTWDGTDWQQTQGASAPPAADHPFCWDPSRQQVVAYIQDTLWGFDGTGWSPVVAGSQNLPPANGAAMAFDVVRQSLVVTGQDGVTWLLGDVAEPVSQSLGSGCPGAGGVPHLASAPPRLGDGAFSIELNDGRAGGLAWLGLALRTQPIAIGGGCSVLTTTPDSLVFGTLSAFGHADAPLPIPLELSLRGLEVFAQAVVFDPQAALGLAVSNGLRLRIGD